MLKYGIEFATGNSSKVTIYSDDKQAKAEAEQLSKNLKAGESMMLFTAQCDDETGKLCSTVRNVVKTWKA